MTELTPSGALDEESQAASGEATGGFDLGADLIDSDEGSNSPAAASIPSEASVNGSADLSQLSPQDLLQRDSNSLPDEWRAAQSWMRNRQSASDRQVSELQNQLRLMQAAQQQGNTAQQVGDAVKEAIHGPQSNDPYHDLKQNIRSAEGYTPGDEASIDVMDQIVGRKFGEQVEQLQAFQKNAATVLQQMYAMMAQQQAGTLDTEVQNLRQQHGSDFVDEFYNGNKDAIHSLMKQRNPNTNKAFTVTEAFGLLSGRQNPDQAAAQARDRNARNDAKRTIAGAGVVTDNSNGAPLSESDLLAQVEALPGFQGRSY
tara:strand:+ start:7820 stop:8761 length:942 start_codon:yes stop_codon:yes gene_type:complete